MILAAPLRRDADIFLADVHLEPESPGRLAAFLRFLDELSTPPSPRALFILGDLFDVWLGAPSLRDPRNAVVLEALRRLSRGGVRVVLFQGNRDFLIDHAFANAAEVEVVEEGCALVVGDGAAFLCHGDRLFREDRAHLTLRGVLRSRAGRCIARLLPPPALRAASRLLRRTSRTRQGGREHARPQLFPASEVSRLLRGGFETLIAGHIHVERELRLIVDGRSRRVFTLGAWEERGSILVHSPSMHGASGFQFHSFAFDP